jgi:hypothetical protein
VEDIAEQLAKRDRFLKHRQMQMTPEQRMEEMQRRQEQARATPMSPEGYRKFLARNYKQRAIDVPIDAT